MAIYQKIKQHQSSKQLAVLLDPEKVNIQQLADFFDKVHQSIVTHVFVGGSTDVAKKNNEVVDAIKKHTTLPVILFPGDVNQLTPLADGILFLSLISGRNPKFLIEQQIKAAPILKKMNLEIISTGYILVDGGKITTVQKVSGTTPIAQNNIDEIVDTAIAGELIGNKMIYLEAGSGAKYPVNPSIISAVKKQLSIPLIVGGGIRTKKQLDDAYQSGADLVVIGTAFENNMDFFKQLKQ